MFSGFLRFPWLPIILGQVLSEKLVSLIHNCEKQYDSMTDDCDRVVKVAACFKVDAKKEGIAPEVAMIEAVMEKYWSWWTGATDGQRLDIMLVLIKQIQKIIKNISGNKSVIIIML